MRDFDLPAEEASDDDPPSGPSFTRDERCELTAHIVRLLWRVVLITTERGTKPLETIAFYCGNVADLKYVYYAIHPSDTGYARVESISHDVNGPIHVATLTSLSDKQLQQLYEIVTYELKQRHISLGRIPS